MSNYFGSVSFKTFGINVCSDGSTRKRQDDFVVHTSSSNANQIFSSGVTKFDEGKYLTPKTSSNAAVVAELDEKEGFSAYSELERLKSEISRATDQLEESTNQFEKLVGQVAEVTKELENLKLDEPALDLVARSLMHFDEPLDSLSWAFGVSKASIAKLVIDSLQDPTPASILGILVALRESFSDGWKGTSPLEDFSAYISEKKLPSKDFSNLKSDLAASSFQNSLDHAEKERETNRVRLKAEIENVNRQFKENKDTQKSLESDIAILREKKLELEESLSVLIRHSLVSVGIFPKKEFATAQILEEIANLTFTHPYSAGEFEVLEAVLQGKFSPHLVRALFSTYLNVFEDGQKTCCMRQANGCRCDPAESSRKEVENRFNLTWSEWKTVLNDRGQYCWPLNLHDQIGILKEMSHFYHHEIAMAHFLESMLTPSWATKVSVLRNRINMSSSLSVQEEATLNSYLRENFGFSRSAAVQTLMNDHPGLKGKSAADIMLMISFLVEYLGIEETGVRLSTLVQREY